MILNFHGAKHSKEPPPNWERLAAAFGLEWGPGVAITYGDTIFSPDHPLAGDRETHEFVHVQQQMSYPGGVEAFVDRYIKDEAFRYKVELEAYQTQWIYAKEKMLPFAIDKKRYLEKLVDTFILDFASGELYENKLSHADVKRDIIKGT